MKKSLKRISAMIFAVALVISLVPTTMAVDGTEDDEFSEFLTNVNSNTIYFEETDSSEDNLAVASATGTDEEQWDKQQRADAKRHNEEVIQKAKEYVWSLDLQSKGLGFIENSCIEELESYEGMDDGQILSYTVYTPKSDSPSIDDLTYLGTHQARKFYTYFPSSMETKSNIKKDTRSTLQKWADQVVSCFLVFQSVEVNAGWYVFQNMMGAPNDYTVKSAAFTESYCNLNIHTRAYIRSMAMVIMIWLPLSSMLRHIRICFSIRWIPLIIRNIMGSDLGIAEMYIHANTKIVQVSYARKHGRYFMDRW